MFQEVQIGDYKRTAKSIWSVVLCSLPDSGMRFGKEYAKDDTYYVFVLDELGEPIINPTMPVLTSTDLGSAMGLFGMRLTLMIREESHRTGRHEDGVLQRDISLRMCENVKPELAYFLRHKFKTGDIRFD